MDLVPSEVFQGTRFRALFNKLYPRPADETFHDFLVNVVKWTFGEEWWKRHAAPGMRHHVVFDWLRAWIAITEREPTNVVESPHGIRFFSEASGPAKALMVFGYDLYCLQAVNRLPDHVVARLRDVAKFQAARYELAVAAMIVRAGFDVQFLDNQQVSAKHCEFVATHRATKAQVAVEAKSRVRPGSLKQRGTFEYAGDVEGIVQLVRRAAKQGVDGLPLVIFVDVNLPQTPGVEPVQKPWVQDFTAAADKLERRYADRDAPYALLVATNFGFHYGDEHGVAAPGEFGVIVPPRPASAISVPLYDAIASSVSRYTRVPEEV